MNEALRNLWRRKVRSALTIFGVAIGIFAFTTMGSLAEYFNASIKSALDFYTTRVTVTAESAGSAGNAGFLAQGGQLPESLADRIKLVDGVLDAYPTITLGFDNEQLATFDSPPLVYAYRPADVEKDPKKLTVKEGRNLREGDVGKTVIGPDIVQEKKVKIGETVKIRDADFEVVGVLQTTNGAPDRFYVITLPEAQTLQAQNAVFSADSANFVTDINVLGKPGVDLDQLARQIDERIQGVSAQPPQQFRKQIEDATRQFSLIIVGSALIALIVGSLSVINTMVMSVSERRKEIGIKKVVGARTRHILREFILETAIVGIIGGLLGLLGGLALTSGINRATADSGITIFSLTPRLALLALGFSVILGVVSGIYPAYRASRIKPVNVLREE